MSYDLMVLDKHKRFERKEDFLNWYNKVTEWEDDLDYNDYKHATHELQEWFLDMKDTFPPLNGELAPSDDEVDEGEHSTCDYAIAKDAIYCAFAWSDAEDAYKLSQEKAKTHDVAFFDVESYIVYYPDGYVMNLADETKASNNKIQESSTKAQTSSSYQKYNFGKKYEVTYHNVWIGYGIVAFFAILTSGEIFVDDNIAPWLKYCLFAATLIVSLVIMFWLKKNKEFIYFNCDGIYTKSKNKYSQECPAGFIPWSEVAECKRVIGSRDELRIALKDGRDIQLNLSGYFFSQDRFYKVVSYYSSMANAHLNISCVCRTKLKS